MTRQFWNDNTAKKIGLILSRIGMAGTAAGMVFILGTSTPCFAAVPQVLNYQGVLTNSSGQPITSNLSAPTQMIFSIYNVLSGGSPLWTESQSVVVTNGLYNVVLGATTAFPATVFSGQDLYLGITVGSPPELTPRIRLTTVPYAIRASVADSLTGGGSGGGITFPYNGVISESVARTSIYGSASGNYGGKEGVLTVANGLGSVNDEIWIGPNTGGRQGHVSVNASDISLNGAGGGLFLSASGLVQSKDGMLPGGNASRFESGSVNLSTANREAGEASHNDIWYYNQVYVTFGKAFSSVPTVIVTPEQVSGSNMVSAHTVAISTTGFSVRLHSLAIPANANCRWMAFGN